MVLALAPFFLGEKSATGGQYRILIRQRHHIDIPTFSYILQPSSTVGIVLGKKSMQTAASTVNFYSINLFVSVFGRVFFKVSKKKQFSKGGVNQEGCKLT